MRQRKRVDNYRHVRNFCRLPVVELDPPHHPLCDDVAQIRCSNVAVPFDLHGILSCAGDLKGQPAHRADGYSPPLMLSFGMDDRYPNRAEQTKLGWQKEKAHGNHSQS